MIAAKRLPIVVLTLLLASVSVAVLGQESSPAPPVDDGASSTLPTSDSDTPDSDTADPDEAKDEADSTTGSQPPAGSAATAAPETTSVAQRIDGAFGTWVVGPIGKLFFFKIFTTASSATHDGPHGDDGNVIALGDDHFLEWVLSTRQVNGKPVNVTTAYVLSADKSTAASADSVSITTTMQGGEAKSYELTAIAGNGFESSDASLHVQLSQYSGITDFSAQAMVGGQPIAVDMGHTSSGLPLVVAWLFAGAVFFTLRMGFINFRAFWHAVRLTRGDYDDPSETGEVSHFQALASALSATVGLGNIAGVALAIAAGGPGASFWIMVVGLLGMTSKFTECTLGQMYRQVNKDGVVLGGPMQYLKTGLTEMGLGPLGKVLATVFALLCVGASFGGGNAFQVGQSMNAVKAEFPILQEYPWIYGVGMAFLAGLVIIGGIKSIGAVAGRIVPVMCVAYVTTALFILATHATEIPGAFGLIVSSAFTWQAGFGGFLGVLVMGIQRAVFSNEAGTGSAAIAHSAAKTDEPVSEGIVALLEPFIDTVVVCTMTALVIVITQVYDTNAFPENAALVAGKEGAALTSVAFQVGGYEWFKWILYLSVVLFAFSTLISWSYYGERCWTSLFGQPLSIVYKVLFLAFTVLGSIVTAGNILDFSDLLILGMAFPNILGVVLLSGKVKGALDDYWRRYKAGELEK
ncbi:MAG: alanine/glycine:cation symporter family protein [Pirellulaceae bacterium]|nr:alanine/glycine:cation symporter family protein [Pirellulaceae bacterium]